MKRSDQILTLVASIGMLMAIVLILALAPNGKAAEAKPPCSALIQYTTSVDKRNVMKNIFAFRTGQDGIRVRLSLYRYLPNGSIRLAYREHVVGQTPDSNEVWIDHSINFPLDMSRAKFLAAYRVRGASVGDCYEVVYKRVLYSQKYPVTS